MKMKDDQKYGIRCQQRYFVPIKDRISTTGTVTGVRWSDQWRRYQVELTLDDGTVLSRKAAVVKNYRRLA
jgi:hypothetical protein